MPGTFLQVFLQAFDFDETGAVVAAFDPRVAKNETVGILEAESLIDVHAGVVVWKREAQPAIGEEGDPVIIWQHGTVGDFD